MQTFLPYPDFVRSAQVLDRARLGKQRIETRDILRNIAMLGTGLKAPWGSHPAIKMWVGYEEALAYYGHCIVTEWEFRGYQNGIEFSFDPRAIIMPSWMGDERFHGSHRANLLRKDPVYYGKFGWTEDPAMPYWWPGKP